MRMPEGTAFRSWYTPEAESVVAKFLAEVCDRHGVRLLDARCWIADEDFWDGHHLLPGGAARFTRRLLDELQ